MATELQYLVKMLVCSSLLFAYYRLALYNERFHQWNRFYLLAALVLSVTLPLVHIPLFAHEQPAAMVLVLEALPWSALPVKEAAWSSADWLTLFLSLVSVFLLFRLITGIVKLIAAFAKGPVSQLDNLKVVMTNMPEAPFSFFSWLYWRNDLNPHTDAGKRMLQHELTHIREGHSLDKLLTEMVLIVFWINPIFWLIKKELNTIHEFLADRKAIEQADGAAFAAMILLAAHPNPTQPLTNPFFSSQIKRRLKMITSSKKPKYSYLRRISGLFTMSLVVIALIFSLEKTQAQKAPPPPPPPPISDTDSILSVNIKQTPKDTVIVYGMRDGRTLKMTPKQARDKGYPPPVPAPAPPAPGLPPAPPAPPLPAPPPPPEAPKKAVEADNFFQAVADGAGSPEPTKQPIVYVDGKLKNYEDLNNINPNTIESISVFKGESAVSKFGQEAFSGVIDITTKPEVVVMGKPTKKVTTTNESNTIVGTGTNVTTNNGVKVRGQSTGTNTVNGTVSGIKIRPTKTVNGQKMNDEVVVVGYATKKDEPIQGNEPLYLLVNPKTGTTTIDKSVVDALDPAKIESVSVLKDKHATDKYGARGKNGVVEIVLK